MNKLHVNKLKLFIYFVISKMFSLFTSSQKPSTATPSGLTIQEQLIKKFSDEKEQKRLKSLEDDKLFSDKYGAYWKKYLTDANWEYSLGGIFGDDHADLKLDNKVCNEQLESLGFTTPDTFIKFMSSQGITVKYINESISLQVSIPKSVNSI